MTRTADARSRTPEHTERLQGYVVTPNFLDTLHVKPALGRGFIAEEGQTGKDAVVILSHGLWTRRFGSDPAIVGRTIDLSGTPTTDGVFAFTVTAQDSSTGPNAPYVGSQDFVIVVDDTPPNAGTVTLRKVAWTLPESLPFGDAEVKPLRGGETIAWRLDS